MHIYFHYILSHTYRCKKKSNEFLHLQFCLGYIKKLIENRIDYIWMIEWKRKKNEKEMLHSYIHIHKENCNREGESEEGRKEERQVVTD